MKHLILAAVLLMPGLNPAMAQQMRGPLFNYVQPKPQTPRQAAISKCFNPWDGKDRQACIDRAVLETDLARPCTVAMAFGCRTGDK